MEIKKIGKNNENISSVETMLEIFVSIHNNNFEKKVDKQYFLEMIECTNYEIYILNDEKKCLGYCIFYDTIESIDLFEIAIKKESQNRGYGKFLLENSINFLFMEKKYEKRNKENKKIILEVKEKNENAIKLYNKIGFEKISIRKNYYGKNENAIIMIKNI